MVDSKGSEDEKTVFSEYILTVETSKIALEDVYYYCLERAREGMEINHDDLFDTIKYCIRPKYTNQRSGSYIFDIGLAVVCGVVGSISTIIADGFLNRFNKKYPRELFKQMKTAEYKYFHKKKKVLIKYELVEKNEITEEETVIEECSIIYES